jgi:hypothetical protein
MGEHLTATELKRRTLLGPYLYRSLVERFFDKIKQCRHRR